MHQLEDQINWQGQTSGTNLMSKLNNESQSTQLDPIHYSSFKIRSQSIEPTVFGLPPIRKQSNPYFNSQGKLERRYRLPASETELINTLILSRDYASLSDEKPKLIAPKSTLGSISIAVTEEERRKQRVSRYLRKDHRRVGR